ncbi:MAG TPA: hypothetical protein VLX64_01330 [Thermoplasmata archaeon]|nr:hypothetical protein [Thermoplasmata archaeon]
MREDARWVSATDLAEYAYCPRSLYYARRFPDAPESTGARDGRRFHDRTLGAECRRASHGAAYWLGLLAGLALTLLAIAAAVR